MSVDTGFFQPSWNSLRGSSCKSRGRRSRRFTGAYWVGAGPRLASSVVQHYYAVISHLDPSMLSLAHEGHAAYRDRFELVFRHRAEKPNNLWQADHTQFDVLIIDANGKPARPWLTTVLDDYSRAIAGYTIFLGAMVCSTDQVLEEALEGAMNKLCRHEKAFQEFRDDGGSAYLFIGIFGPQNFGLEFTPNLLGQLSDLGIEIGLDIYPGAPTD